MTYEASLEKSREATRKFMAVQADYRARKIDDAEYLAARAEYEVSEKEFDVAFAKEAA